MTQGIRLEAAKHAIAPPRALPAFAAREKLWRAAPRGSKMKRSVEYVLVSLIRLPSLGG
ncbi:hypothetical protein DEA8626_01038 [Defluviimonas aquaemixtae]|uniref:Uncharacterized protein n=1 Tax=Albidovulum aquaemixtae TaxID=1542388 RepID=A0A2R8B4H8_9RHOB|nr:hypothetical protein DEA8626_01038 [Defluviimonas aquaemixtae]